MSTDLNRVQLLGNIASEPEVYVTRAGMTVLTLRVSTVEDSEKTTHHQVVMVGRRADAVSKVLHKGARIFVEGSLRTFSFEGRDGKKYSKTEVLAQDILFAGEKAA